MIGLGALIVLRGLAELARASGLGARLDRSLWLIPASMVVFGLSIEPLGLVVALALSDGRGRRRASAGPPQGGCDLGRLPDRTLGADLRRRA